MSKRLIDSYDKWKYAGLLLLICIVILGTCANAKGISPYSEQMIDSVKIELENNDVQHSEIVLKQSIWETGWFGCRRCSLSYNNLFGFRLKKYISDSNPKGYIPFDNWRQCILYYKTWQSTYYKGGDYYKFLDKIGFAEDKNYTKNIKSIRL